MCACGLNMQRERTVGSVSRLFGFIRAHGNNRHTVGFWVPPHPLQSNQECLHKRGKKICMTDKYIYTPKYICKKNALRQLASQVSGWKEMGLSLWTRQLVCIKNTYVHDLVNNMIFFLVNLPQVWSVYTLWHHTWWLTDWLWHHQTGIMPPKIYPNHIDVNSQTHTGCVWTHTHRLQ